MDLLEDQFRKAKSSMVASGISKYMAVDRKTVMDLEMFPGQAVFSFLLFLGSFIKKGPVPFLLPDDSYLLGGNRKRE